MKDLVKVLFFVVAGIFFISYVQDAGVLGNTGFGGSGTSHSSSRTSYSRSYDENNDGVVSSNEYQSGELERIEQELEELTRLVAQAREEQNRSPYYGDITLRRGNTRADNPREEYLIIRSNRRDGDPIFISGWKLESLVSGNRATLPKGVALLEDDRPWRGEKNVFLLPGESAVVNSAYASGINTGFLTNACIGYLEENRDFTPGLRNNCPLLEDEPLAANLFPPSFFDDDDDFDACWDAIEDAPMCRKAFPDLDTDIDELKDCRAFIRKYATYEGCVALHKTDPDFLGDEWRLYLGARRDLWRSEREAIALFDHNGFVVDILELQ
ncbi:MAG: hypothetical protein AMXMBFR44_0170 [Candidatus Campbellbacteria bacterium]